jgi:alcohol oxidase
MKPRSDNGVVDSKLNVYGTQNLKVAGRLSFLRFLSPLSHSVLLDLSIAPENVGGNTYNTA